MNSVSRKILTENPEPIKSQTWLCECCGKKVVLLRAPDWTAREEKYVLCYERTWDGNPWYTGRVHHVHPEGRVRKLYPEDYAYGFDKRREKKEVDPFFTLD